MNPASLAEKSVRKRQPPEPPVAELPHCTLDEIRNLVVLPLWHRSDPSVAAILRVSRPTVYAMAQRGDIPTIRVSANRVVVPVPKLLALLGDSAGAEVVQ